MKDSVSRFSNRVDNYLKYRPHYPQAVIETLKAECGLTNESVVADVGSGTGFLTELFLANGNEVFGVEPNREMREAAERYLERFGQFHSVDGTAEATTLPDRSVDFVTAGQAFHWFDREQAKREFARILRPGGWVVVVWNERLTDAGAFLAAYEQLLLKYAMDYEKIDHRRITRDVLAAFFSPCSFAGRQFPNKQICDCESLKGRLLSSSYTPAPGQPGHEAMLAELKMLFDDHNENGQVEIQYSAQIYYGNLTATP